MKKYKVRWRLVVYDLLVLIATYFLLLMLRHNRGEMTPRTVLLPLAVSAAVVLAARFLFRIYRQIWRYGSVRSYLLLMVADLAAFFVDFVLLKLTIPSAASGSRLLSFLALNLLVALSIRMLYRYAIRNGNEQTAHGRFWNRIFRLFAGRNAHPSKRLEESLTPIAIVGAGRTGSAFADEILNNPASPYVTRCFVDISPDKVGRDINGIPVLRGDEHIFQNLKEFEVQEVVFAVPCLGEDERKRLYQSYMNEGYRIKVYDYPTAMTADGKRHLREFDIEELLFRKPIVIENERLAGYYRDKVILITGGGGSIGSEMCRQLAKLSPKQIIILDIYENGAYDVQQELRIAYKGALNIKIEICSITNKPALRRVFERYHPEIVINAAAHKHVPLMEHNCVEAVENNVFGTKNIVELCEEFGVGRFMMVSTDKAVNPTNVMGATKRMCEMIVLSASTRGRVKYSVTRFGNVLGSAGSVIPLFKKQIANGGPITLTDRRIIRYFMTIPEATQLVLQSGEMAKNGELFVLDMGQPVKILDLAENMIRLSGVPGIEIVETGLREGEKLYEELLVKTEELDKTENSLIFIEREKPHSAEEIDGKLTLLREACATGDDDFVRETLKKAVPTFRSPDEVNAKAEQAQAAEKQAQEAREAKRPLELQRA